MHACLRACAEGFNWFMYSRMLPRVYAMACRPFPGLGHGFGPGFANKRYFVLSGCSLSYWETQEDAEKQMKPLGCQDLSICTFVPHGQIDGKYCYEINAVSKSQYLWAETSAEMQDWIECIASNVSLGRGRSNRHTIE